MTQADWVRSLRPPPHKRVPRTLTFQQWLLLLLTACILPFTLATSLLFYSLYKRERGAIEMATLYTARALAQVVDRELSSARGAAEAMASSPHLSTGNLAAFHSQASDFIRTRPGYRLVLISDDGQPLANTGRPWGTALPPDGNTAQSTRVREARRTLISDLYHSALDQQWVVSVDTPVLVEGKVRYVLSIQVFSEHLSDLLKHQRVPTDRVVAVLDSAGIVVARSRDPQRYIGKPATPALRARIAQTAEGIIEDRTLEGIPSIAVFSNSTLSKWSVVIGLHREVLTAALARTFAMIATGALLLFLLGVAVANRIGQRLVASVRGLIAPAVALGEGKPVTLPHLHLREALEVGQALHDAADLIQLRTAERDQAEQAERALREAKLAVERSAAALRASEARFRGVFEHAPVGIGTLSANAHWLDVNQALCDMVGYPRTALLGSGMALLLHPDELVLEAQHRQQLLSGAARIDQCEVRCLHRDGHVVPVLLTRTVLRDDLGHAVHVIAHLLDMSERQRHEHEERRNAEAIRAALRDKETLLRELYHRVKNNLQLITSMFSLQVRALPEGLARTALSDATGRVRAMALVHEKLYQSGNLSSIQLTQYTAELCEQLGRAVGAAEHGIELVTEVAPLEIGLDTAVPLGLLLNELITNSLKHGFVGRSKGVIRVQMHPLPDGKLSLQVADDGVGFPPGIDPYHAQTLGLKLVAALVQQLGGELTLDRQQGASVTIVFPPGGESMQRQT